MKKKNRSLANSIVRAKAATVTARATSGQTSAQSDLYRVQSAASAAVRGDERFKCPTSSSGYQPSPYVLDVIKEGDSLWAVFNCDGQKLRKIAFTYDEVSGKATLVGEAMETEMTTVYARSVAAVESVVRAGGTSEGARMGWEHRNRFDRYGDGNHPMTEGTHVTEHENEDLGLPELRLKHEAHLENHEEQEALEVHKHIVKKGGTLKEKAKEKTAKASARTTSPTIHCRDSGSTLPAKSKWEAGEPVDFQWLPGGVHTISAGFESSPSGSIELTVECSETTAEAVQASYEDWTTQSRQEPFGCVEHREEEAAFRLPKSSTKFAWKDDPEPGVFCTAVPTELGARNVNGGMHRSFSPSFSTDAEYAKARMSCCKKAASVCKCSSPGQMQFPVGARGSKSNPAQVTGVAFSVGSLTNKPAFKQIMPVKAKHKDGVDIVEAAGTSEGAKKGWEARGFSHLGSYEGGKVHLYHKQFNDPRFGAVHRVVVDDGEPETGNPVGFSTKEEALKRAKKYMDEAGYKKDTAKASTATLSEAIRAYAPKTLDEAIRAAEIIHASHVCASGTSEGVAKSWETRRGKWTASADEVIKKAEEMASGGPVQRTIDTSKMSEIGKHTFGKVNEFLASGKTAAGNYLKEQWFHHSNAADRAPDGSEEAKEANEAASKIAEAYEKHTGKEL